MEPAETAVPRVLASAFGGFYAETSTWFVLLLLVAASCAAAIPMVAPLADRLCLVAHPSTRCIHDRPIAKHGGVVVFIVFVVATTVLLPLSPFVSALLAGGAIVTMGGAVDDRRRLPWKWKIAVQSLAIMTALCLSSGALRVPAVSTDGFGAGSASVMDLAGSLLLLLFTINASNLTDGLDGLLAGVSSCSLFILAILAADLRLPDVGFAAVILMACLVGFLAHNAHPAKIFLGDSGSQFVGFMIGLCILQILPVVAATGSQRNLGAVCLAISIVGYPVVDVVFVVFRRLLAGHHIFVGDRRHLHHVLLDTGIPHGRAVQYLTLLQASVVGVAVAMAEL